MKNKIENFHSFVKQNAKGKFNTFDEIISIFINMVVDENIALNALLEERIENLSSDQKKKDLFYANYFGFSKELFVHFHNIIEMFDPKKLDIFARDLGENIYNLISKNKEQKYVIKGVRTILMTVVSKYNIDIKNNDKEFLQSVEIAFPQNENLKSIFRMLFMFSNENANYPEIKISKDILIETLSALVLLVLFAMIQKLLNEEDTVTKSIPNKPANNTQNRGTWRITPKIYQLKISLKGAKPPIWRRVLVEADDTFYALHAIIQNLFNWEGYHMYEFYGKAGNYTDTEFIEEDYGYNNVRNYDSDDVKIDNEFKNVKDKIKYTYDFGDDWNLDIELEKILDFDAKKKYPICTGGRRNGPIEDCGGIYAYSEIVDIIENNLNTIPEHLLSDEGDFFYADFDPSYFNKDEITKRLR